MAINIPPALKSANLVSVAIGAATIRARVFCDQYTSNHPEIFVPLYGETPTHNDGADAFRHAFTSAYFANLFGRPIAEALGDMNEIKGDLNLVGNPKAELNMDVWNNAIGRDIGAALPVNTPAEKIAEEVIKAISEGKLITSLNDPLEREASLSPFLQHFLDAIAVGRASYLFYQAANYLGVLSWPDKVEFLKNSLVSAGSALIVRDPLALDLNGDGIIATRPLQDGTHFDSDGNGFSEASGWISSSDGFLVRDIDQSGSIDNGGELFGDQTLLLDGSFATNGFNALAALDSNRDGIINSLDTSWSELKVWKDTNSNGVSEAGELHNLTEMGIIGFNLGYDTVFQRDANGNTLAFAGTFVKQDGTLGAAGSMLFARDPVDSFAKEIVEVSHAVQTLPDIDGFGNVFSLHQAMARDSALQAAVEGLASSTNYETLRRDFEVIVQKWTGAYSIVPTSRGTSIDARNLSVLEAFYGQSFSGVDGPNPNSSAAPILETAYQQLLDGLYVKYVGQAQLRPVWDAVKFNWNEVTASLTSDYTPAITVMKALLDESAGSAVTLLYAFAKSIKFYGEESSLDFSVFMEAFKGSPDGFDKVLELGLAGNPLITGQGTSDTLVAVVPSLVYAANGDDTVQGSSGADVLLGGAGNDKLDGGWDSDTLIGGAGDDVLGGTSLQDVFGNLYAYNSYASGLYNAYDALGYYYNPALVLGNTYTGGAGNDILNGTAGADVYFFNRGDGQDVINERIGSGVTDRLVFGEGIAAADVTVSRNGNDLVLQLAGGADRVSIANWFGDYAGSGSYQVEHVEFADGTVWLAPDLTVKGLTVTGTDAAETLRGVTYQANAIDGRGGNDTVIGGNLADTLHGGAGDDTVSGSHGNDALFGDDGADKLNGEDGNDMLDGGSGNDVLDGGWGSDTLIGGDGDDVLGGTSLHDVFGNLNAYSSYSSGSYKAYDATGYYYNPSLVQGNTYTGGKGNDTLNGTAGADTYYFNQGEGQDVISERIGTDATDRLVFGEGITAADVTVSRNGTDLVLQLASGTDRVSIANWFGGSSGSIDYQVERVEFSDGTVWLASDLTVKGLNVTGTDAAETLRGVTYQANAIDGRGGNDTVIGGNLADMLHGGSGDDTVSGSYGNDALFGDDGADKLNGDDGNDILDGGSGNDVLDGGWGSDTLIGGAGDDVLGGTSVHDVFGNLYAYDSYSSSSYKAYDALGYYYNPALVQGNTYTGGLGNDTLNGTAGADVYFFNRGDGQDTLIERAGTSLNDRLVFGESIVKSDVSAARNGLDLVLQLANSLDSVTVKNWFNNSSSGTNFQVEQLEFTDGTVWLASDITTQSQNTVSRAQLVSTPSHVEPTIVGSPVPAESMLWLECL
jgi:Ca2+-binding RTX toxin-like protein